MKTNIFLTGTRTDANGSFEIELETKSGFLPRFRQIFNMKISNIFRLEFLVLFLAHHGTIKC